MKTYSKFTAATLSLPDILYRESVELFVDVETTTEKDLPAIIKENPSVMVSLEVPCKPHHGEDNLLVVNCCHSRGLIGLGTKIVQTEDNIK